MFRREFLSRGLCLDSEDPIITMDSGELWDDALKSIMQRSVLTKGKLGESSVTSLPYQVEVFMKFIL